MNRLLRLLTIIVISRGYILLNEQFLVRICFVRFISTVILYYGENIKIGLETKRNELIKNQQEYIEKKKALKREFIVVLNNRIGITSNLARLNNEIINRVEIGFKNKQLQYQERYKEIILNELQLILQYQDLVIPTIQNEIINYIRQNFHNKEKQYFITYLYRTDEEDLDHLETSKSIFDSINIINFIEDNMIEEEEE